MEICRSETFTIFKQKRNRKCLKNYKILSSAEKSQIVEYAKRNGIFESMCKFKNSQSNIKRWLENGLIRKKGCGRKVKDFKLDEEVKKWVETMKKNGRFLKDYEIRKKAKELSNDSNFKASNGWLIRFKVRYNNLF